jgi:hypothetical protein
MSKVNLNFEVDKQLKDQIKRAADLEGKKVLRFQEELVRLGLDTYLGKLNSDFRERNGLDNNYKLKNNG